MSGEVKAENILPLAVSVVPYCGPDMCRAQKCQRHWAVDIASLGIVYMEGKLVAIVSDDHKARPECPYRFEICLHDGVD